MEIKGDEFLKNVKVKQEEETLKQKLNEFENLRQQNSASNPYKEYVNNEQPYDDNELGDILLQNSAKNDSKENKKKYIILGVALVLLFVITIVIIRLITSDGANDVKFQEQSTLEQDKALNDEKIQQEYQQILNDKLKKVNENSVVEVPKETQEDLKQLQEQEEALPAQEEQQPNPLNIVKEEPVVEPVKTETPMAKPVIKKEPVPVKTSPSTATTKGVYIQIGAFSKTPSDKYLSEITSKGYNFKLHKMNVQGKELIKVLVGPYSSRTQAQENLNSVRTTLGASGAYILEI
ncbi:MAG: SPOR domain-containing protein [Sulfurimonadaceae bacterium]